MKLLLITPGIHKSFNDNAFSYIYMAHRGVKICAISNQTRRIKGHGISKEFEKVDEIEVYRIYSNFKEQTSFYNKKWPILKKILFSFQPEIILCSQQKNMHLALRIKREFDIPIVLLVEFAYDKLYPFRLIGKERFIRSRLFGSLLARLYWKWLSQKSAAIITCNPNDSEKINKLKKFNNNVFVVPWPSYPTYKAPKNLQKFKRGIFIGALDYHKNIPEFEYVLPKIFNNTPIKKFVIIGQGEFTKNIEVLQKKFPGRLIHIPKMERHEALEWICHSYFAYIPAKFGAWGFIGDCWAMKTPIIVTTNHYQFQNRKDSLVCNKNTVDQAVNSLFNDRPMYRNLQEIGYERFINIHYAPEVGEKYMSVLARILEGEKNVNR